MTRMRRCTCPTNVSAPISFSTHIPPPISPPSSPSPAHPDRTANGTHCTYVLYKSEEMERTGVDRVPDRSTTIHKKDAIPGFPYPYCTYSSQSLGRLVSFSFPYLNHETTTV